MICTMDDYSYDYSRLPTLVLNEIFGYLSFKERIRCKSVCRAWKMEIELREKARDTLVLHLGPYLRNMRWTHTNNGRLMKFENSFEVKRLNFLQHPRSQTLLKKIKKLAIVNYGIACVNEDIVRKNVHPYIHHFDQCEEIEIREFHLENTTLTFKLPRLKALVIRECLIGKLVLNCPSLELFYYNWPLQELCFRSTKSLKRFFCCDWRVSSNVKFPKLEYLNLYSAKNEPVSDQLLSRMPKLKRFVLNSNDLQADLESIHEQQQRYGLNKLEVLCAGFSAPVELVFNQVANCYVEFEKCVDELFENYSKLVENWPWKVWIDYSKLFNKFKILPSDFFERFREPYGIEISAVTNYNHLFEFLRCYPFAMQMKLDWQSVQANRVLDMVHLLNPSLRELTIVEERSSHVLDIDLSFMYLLDLAYMQLASTRLPIEFIRRVAARRGPHLSGLGFIQFEGFRHILTIYFYPKECAFVDNLTAPRLNFNRFSSLEKLIAALRAHPVLSTFLC